MNMVGTSNKFVPGMAIDIFPELINNQNIYIYIYIVSYV